MSKIHDIGRVYCIRSYQTDNIYIGSTFQPLHKRIYGHKSSYKQWQNKKHNYITSFELIKYDDCYIELIEEYKNLNKKELEKYEGDHIRKNDCVNKIIVGRTQKEYYKDNNDKILEQKKEYYQDNNDKIKEQRKYYYKEKSNDVKNRVAKYRIQNSKKIKERYTQKHICACGSQYSHYQKLRHERSKKHLDFINKK